MRKAFRLTFSAALLSSLAISQLPEPSHCQMVYGAIFAASCRMPCCQTKLPMPNCPFLKAAATRDFITRSGPVLKVALQPLHSVRTIVVSQARTWSSTVAGLAETITLLFIGPSLPVRAPPANVYLLAA
jgi:hypothetical protein